jgi:hypothetical protein
VDIVGREDRPGMGRSTHSTGPLGPPGLGVPTHPYALHEMAAVAVLIGGGHRAIGVRSSASSSAAAPSSSSYRVS